MTYQTPRTNLQTPYTDPPPYSPTSAGGSREPILGREWEENDIPDDFKMGVYVDQCTSSVRNAFVRKVYSILSIQLLTTLGVGFAMVKSDDLKGWVFANQWSLWVSMFGTFGVLIALYWKSHSYPANYILLGAFTLFESYLVGATVTIYDVALVLQALIITLGVFIGLSIFTLQSKYDFSGMGPYLIGLLWLFVIVGFVQLFLPFNSGFELFLGIGGAILFSAFIIYDTSVIMHQMSPEEYIIAAITLYLDILNLFLSILRILNSLNQD